MDKLNFNESLLVWINQDLSNPLFDVFFTWLSMKAGFSLPLILLIILYIGKRYGKQGWIFGGLIIILTIFTDLIGNTLKDLFQHARPCLEMYDLIRAPFSENTQCETSTSGMPSNHAMNFFSVFTFISFFFPYRKVIISSFGIAALVAISRVYLGDHFPSQILVGSAIGMALGLGFAGLIHKWQPSLRFYENKNPPTSSS